MVDNNVYLWAVARYIERNPLKADLVQRVEDYPWSSGRAHLSGTTDGHLQLSNWLEPTERGAYASFVITDDTEQNTAIRKATRTGRPYGSECFVDTLEYELNRTVRVKKAGRPRKAQ